MGYTHYWRREKSLDQDSFSAFTDDVRKILQAAENKGVALGNNRGEESPVVTGEKVAFNGAKTQPKGRWTTDEEIVIPWPAEGAGAQEPDPDPAATKTKGSWFAGDRVSQHVAPEGSGNYEPVFIERVFTPADWEEPDENGLWFRFCKTAYRPYDIPTCATLIAAKRHFGDRFYVSSDGTQEQWLPGVILCMNACGYGEQFDIWSE